MQVCYQITYYINETFEDFFFILLQSRRVNELFIKLQRTSLRPCYKRLPLHFLLYFLLGAHNDWCPSRSHMHSQHWKGVQSQIFGSLMALMAWQAAKMNLPTLWNYWMKPLQNVAWKSVRENQADDKETWWDQLTYQWQELETVKQFKFLGAIITDEGSKAEIQTRTAQTTAPVAKLKPIWSNKNISLESKLKLLHSLVISIFLCACKTWTLMAELEWKIQVVEMRYFCKILGITYLDHVTNEEVHNIIIQCTGSYKDLLTTMKKRKLKWNSTGEEKKR